MPLEAADSTEDAPFSPSCSLESECDSRLSSRYPEPWAILRVKYIKHKNGRDSDCGISKQPWTPSSPLLFFLNQYYFGFSVPYSQTNFDTYTFGQVSQLVFLHSFMGNCLSYSIVTHWQSFN